jgi:hypothetical protein
MPKPVFVDGVTVVSAEFLNSIYGQGANGGHDHLGEDRLGSASRISFDELDPQLQTLINDLLAIKPLVSQLEHNGMRRFDLFGGTGRDGNFNGEWHLNNPLYEFINFTIPPGVTIRTERGFVRIKCTGNFTIHAGGTLEGVPLNQYGLGDAWYNNSGPVYNPLAQLYGSGGGETVDHTDLSGLSVVRHRGGNGGCGIVVEALGNIVIQGTIRCDGGDGMPATIISGTGHILGGSGGGSGGLIALHSFSRIDISGTLSVKGGRGADGYGSNAAGGGGGGGGWVRCVAPIANGSMANVQLSGGLAGTNIGLGTNLGAGGGSFAGKGGNSKEPGQPGLASIVGTNKYTWW